MGELLKRKIGPFQVWQFGLIVLVAAAFFWYRKRVAPAKTEAREESRRVSDNEPSYIPSFGGPGGEFGNGPSDDFTQPSQPPSRPFPINPIEPRDAPYFPSPPPEYSIPTPVPRGPDPISRAPSPVPSPPGPSRRPRAVPISEFNSIRAQLAAKIVMSSPSVESAWLDTTIAMMQAGLPEILLRPRISTALRVGQGGISSASAGTAFVNQIINQWRTIKQRHAA